MRRMMALTNAFSLERLDLKWARNEFADYNFVGEYIPAETHSRFGERIDRSCLEDSETLLAVRRDTNAGLCPI